jgi:antitoxin component YwqK of YwqJK toxin-antitoxin module
MRGFSKKMAINLVIRIGFIWMAFMSQGCNSPEKTFVVDIKDDSTGKVLEKQIYSTKDSLATGVWENYAPNGMLIDSRPYREGKLHGIRRIYDDQGRLQIEENYLHGEFEGPYTAYHENGKVRVSGQYKNNTMDSIWTYFYASGAVREKVAFKDNLENGPFTEYYENGKMKTKGDYLGGDKEHGKLELFDSTGQLVRTMECEYGRCRTVWKKESGE